MNPAISTEIREVMEAVHYQPAISIMMPFEPKMGLKAKLAHALEMATDKIEGELLENYPNEMSTLLMRKLKTIINNLNFDTHKKSIAIYVSPVFEKVLYLDIVVEKKIIIGESFEIRDLVYNKKEDREYLVLLLNTKEGHIYLGNSSSFIKIVSNHFDLTKGAMIDLPERVSNFSDITGRKEIELDKFLRRVDNGLDIILTSYPLPLFIMGAKRILGHFKKLTKHAGAVIDYIPGHYDNMPLPELKESVEPFIKNWKKVKQQDLLNQLDNAAGKQKLAVGMKDVWRVAMGRKGRLLLVEKNYRYAAEHGSSDEIIYKATEPYNKFSYIKDTVDDVIEKVLENGGDVEFVDEGLLAGYHHIALIQFY
ncbi:MAG: hypothetical protein WAU23_12270 [Ferruginibacter sp.]